MHPTLSGKHCQACSLELVAPSSFLLIKIILKWLMDARSSKQSTAAQLTNGPMDHYQRPTDPWSSDSGHILMSYAPLDQGSVAVAKGKCEQHFVLQLQVVPEPLTSHTDFSRVSLGSIFYWVEHSVKNQKQ